ncbi:unnamed protein product [Brachionus calyciflorus]|uniref:Uncharacterized protein n=1 Tax=Brachionus calyciflorus TaxID=104777 RepID=A0A814L472_9BILA|nr:unnamed protein product [Brachionus calyciflorus]
MPSRTKRSRAAEENFNKRTDQIFLIRDPEDSGDQGQNVFNLDKVLSNIDDDDPCVILRDGRGCYKRITFNENYPELEKEAKAFALNVAAKKTCDFNAYLLSQFVDKTFREIYPDDVIYFANDSNVFIKSVES